MTHKVLVIDDEEMNFDLVEHALKGEYTLAYAVDGKQGLEKVESFQPDVILLDVQMPVMNGYETCKSLRENSDHSELPVIFVSSLDSIEERMAGYEAGGDDYIVKPFQADELRRKVELSISNLAEKKNLKQNASMAMDTAMQAITSTGEIGVILNFFSRSFDSKTLEELAREIVKSMNEYQLKVSIKLNTPDGILNYDSSGIPKPLETALLDKLADGGRILDYDARTIINFPHVSMLFKNMPLDNPEKWGRYKDNLALFVEGADARVQAIINEQAVAAQQTFLKEMLNRTEKALNDISEQHHKHKTASTHIMEVLIGDIEDSFLRLGLTEEQEQALMELVTSSADKAISLYDESMEVDKQLEQIMKELKAASRLGE